MATRSRRRRNAVLRTRAGTPGALTNGIDVSHHQGKIDWPKVASAGIRYAIIKATQGAGFIDARFAENWQGTGLNNIVRGAYHFFDPAAPIDAQFENFTHVVSLVPGDLAPALDLEVDGQNWAALPQAKRVPAALQLLALLEDHYGVTPIVYTNRRTVNEVFAAKPGDLTRYPLWVASYRQNPPPTMPAGWTDWKHWQHTDRGSIDGIGRTVDLNRCVGDPGPVVQAITETPFVSRRALVSASDAVSPSTGPQDPLAAFDRVWRSIREDSGRFFADGISEANVQIAIEASGATSISIQVRGRAGGPRRRERPASAAPER